VTDRRTAESETELLAAVVASVSDAVVTVDRGAAVVRLNPAAERLLGTRTELVVGQDAITLFVHPDDRVEAQGWVSAIAGGAQLRRQRSRLVRADGSAFDAELDLFPVLRGGEMLGMAGVVRDVTAQLAAEEEGELLRAILEVGAEAVIGVDCNGTVLLFSRAAETIYGYAADEVIGRPLEQLLAEHRRARYPRFMDRLTAGQDVSRTTVGRRKDGSYVEIEVRAHPIHDGAGAVRGAAITVLDISEQRRSQRLLDRIVEHAPTAITVKDARGRYVIVNRSAARTLGRQAEAMIGRTDEELFDPDMADLFRGTDRHVLETGETMTFEEEFPAADGRRSFVTTKFAIRGAHDVVDGIGVMVADVTEIRQAASDRARLAALVQSAPDAIVAQDANGQIATWNPGAEAMFGLPAEQAIGRDYAQTVVPEHERERHLAIRREVHAGRTVSIRTVRMRADGSVFPARVSAAPVRMLDGAWSGTLSIIRDITDLAAAEAELEARAAQLERSNADLERFAYAASHDLQEPLQSIKLSAGAVIDAASERLDADERELLSHIDAAASRLSGQIRGLMEVARVALGGGPQERAPVELAVQDALDALRAAARGAGAQIDVHRPLPEASVPRTELALVLQNLIANGIKYHRHDVPPRITVSGSTGETYLELRVADNGIGLSTEDRERVFGVFERVPSDIPGTGMGLATVRRMVERHGGTITVASAGPGRGSEFTVRLPLRDRGRRARPRRPPRPATRRPSPRSGRHPRPAPPARRGRPRRPRRPGSRSPGAGSGWRSRPAGRPCPAWRGRARQARAPG
jgi:PAS domain S-box-containing protein